jgi:DNA invertase Pin-like site-specific DNA recombinase
MENQQNQEDLRYCLYARKSTESDEKQAMSIESQVKEMLTLAQRDGLTVVEIKREAHSAKATGQRPVFNEMLAEVRTERFNAILTWAPDRLSRNAGDLGAIVDMLDQKKIVEIRTFSQRFTNNPNEKFLLMILGAQGKLENDQKGLNVKRGLRAKCELGLWPAPAPTGYLNEMRTDRKGYIMIDPVRGPIVRQMFEKVGNDGLSGRKVFKWLREIGFRTVNDKPIWISNVYKILNTPLYYGEFEYPIESGRWYKGRHEPLIGKDLFDRVQKNMRLERDFQYRAEGFAFTKLMRCGKCGSGITAQEKHKKLKRGGEATYVYYGCTRSKDIHCPVEYLREEELIEQLIGIIDSASMDELGLRKHLREDIERHEKFQTMLGVKADKARLRDIDLKQYAKHVLMNGGLEEKRAVLSHLKDRLVLDNRRISLEMNS